MITSSETLDEFFEQFSHNFEFITSNKRLIKTKNGWIVFCPTVGVLLITNTKFWKEFNPEALGRVVSTTI